MGYRINDNALRCAAVFPLGFQYNDAGAIIVFQLLHSESEPQIDDGDHLAPKVYDPLDLKRRLGNRSDGYHADDLPD